MQQRAARTRRPPPPAQRPRQVAPVEVVIVPADVEDPEARARLLDILERLLFPEE